MKMFQNWIQAVHLLLFYQRIVSAQVEVKEDGEEVKIKCAPASLGSLVLWFRVLDNDNTGMEFIGSFSRNDGSKKAELSSDYSATKSKSDILVLNSFKKERDSGIYGCLSINNNKIVFGKATQLAGPDPPKIPTVSAPLMTPSLNQPPATKPCACNSGRGVNEDPAGSCDPLMWGPLAGGCGLLLTLLIVTICYCNRIRTRRCPHHYKRHNPRLAPEKQAMVNRPV